MVAEITLSATKLTRAHPSMSQGHAFDHQIDRTAPTTHATTKKGRPEKRDGPEKLVASSWPYAMDVRVEESLSMTS